MTEVSRRELGKLLLRRGAGIGAAAYTLAPLGYVVKDLIFGEEAHPEVLAEHAPLEHREPGPLETAVDYAGVGNFAKGIYNLASRQTLTTLNYVGAMGLLRAKFVMADEAGRHHVTQELRDGWDALRIILGTTIAAEGVGMDLDRITKITRGRSATLEEKIFMIAALSPLTSWTTTTVGSSTIFRSEVNSLIDSVAGQYEAELVRNKIEAAQAKESAMKLRKDMYADTIGHVSDSSGFMFLGDPPFIAMIQKYGVEGFKFQNKTMLAPVIYSTARTLVKLTAKARAAGLSVSGGRDLIRDKNNWSLYGQVIGDSLLNTARLAYNIGGTDGGRLTKEDPRGITQDPLGAFEDKIANVRHAAQEYFNSIADAPGYASKLRAAAAILSARDVKERLHHSVGENMADVLTVFPFQAMSIPFLQRAFKDGLAVMDGMHPEARDLAMYLAIAGFSSMADNYVACKIGLELYPERPELPLTAAIIGGQLLPPGNMANMTLVSQRQYNLNDGLKRLHRHADMLGIGYGYAKAFPMLRRMPGIGSLFFDKSGILRAMEATAPAHR